MGHRLGKSLHPLSGALDQRQGGDELSGHVGADLGGEGGEVVERPGGEAQDRGRVGAAATESGRDRDPLLDPHAQGRMVPAPGPQALQRPGGEVLALDPGAEDLVALALDDVDQVGQGKRLKQGAESVQAVLAAVPPGRGRG